MGHRRIKKPKYSSAELRLAVRKILFPADNVQVPGKFQSVVQSVERLVQQNAGIVDTQYTALHTCARMLERLTDRSFEYTGPSSQGFKDMLEEIARLRQGVNLVIQMMDAYSRVGAENSIESLKAVEHYHDKVYGAMFEILTECQIFLRTVTARTPNSNAEPNHPIWKILKEIEHALDLGPATSEKMRELIKKEFESIDAQISNPSV